MPREYLLQAAIPTDTRRMQQREVLGIHVGSPEAIAEPRGCHEALPVAFAPAVSPSVQQSQLPVEHNELSERDENRYFGAHSGHGFAIRRTAYAYSLPSFEINLIGAAIHREYLAKK